MNGTATCEISPTLTLHNTSDQHQSPVPVMVDDERMSARFLSGSDRFASHPGRDARIILETTGNHSVRLGDYEVRLDGQVVGTTRVRATMTGVSIPLSGIRKVLPAGTELTLSRAA